MAIRPALAAAFVLTATACGPIPIHGDPAAAPTATSVSKVEASVARHVVAGDGIEIHAFLWDAALLAAATRERGVANDWPQGWAPIYLERTSFTVVVEVEDRWPAIGAEEILTADLWAFHLDRGGNPDTSPEEVRLLVADRFPTTAGRHHHRLVFAVHFAGALAPSLHEPATLRLHVGLRPAPEGTRPMTGHVLRSRGATLRFRVAPA